MIDRQSMIEFSVTALMKAALAARGYDESHYEIVEAWPGKGVKLTKTLIAIGFNFDDGGTEGETGSDLRHRFYTFEFYVFGTTNVAGRNIANVVKFAMENGDLGEGTVPLMDLDQHPPVEIDRLVVHAAHAQRVPMLDPEPWQQFSWLTTIMVEDYYYAHAA